MKDGKGKSKNSIASRSCNSLFEQRRRKSTGKDVTSSFPFIHSQTAPPEESWDTSRAPVPTTQQQMTTVTSETRGHPPGSDCLAYHCACPLRRDCDGVVRRHPTICDVPCTSHFSNHPFSFHPALPSIRPVCVCLVSYRKMFCKLIQS